MDKQDEQTERLIRYMDGELSKAEAGQVEARLKTDQACQAEHLALKQVDQLLLNVPMVTPPADFMAKFEARLEKRVKRRRNILGVSIISLVLMLATGLLLWSFADSGLTLLSFVNGVSLFERAVDLLQSVLASVGVIFRIGTLMIGTMVHLVKHPVFWGYILLMTGVVSLWAQILRWVGFARTSVTA